MEIPLTIWTRISPSSTNADTPNLEASDPNTQQISSLRSTEVLLQADSRARVAHLVEALGGEPNEVLAVTPPALTGKPEASQTPESADTYSLDTQLPARRAPIPAGSQIFTAPAGKYPPPARQLQTSQNISPMKSEDTPVAPELIQLPDFPRMWVANPATLAVPVVPVVFGLILLLVSPGAVTVFLLAVFLLAAAGEFAYARWDNQRQWASFENLWRQIPPHATAIAAARNQKIRQSIPDFDQVIRADSDQISEHESLWGFPADNLRVPIGFTQTDTGIEYRQGNNQLVFQGWGAMSREWNMKSPTPIPADTQNPLTSDENADKPGLITAASGAKAKIVSRVQGLSKPIISASPKTLQIAYASASAGALAIIGAQKWRDTALNHLIGRIALRYSPQKLVILALTSREHDLNWSWLTYLPHTKTVRDWLGKEIMLIDPAHESRQAEQIRAFIQHHQRKQLLVVIDGELPAGSALEELLKEPKIWVINTVEQKNLAPAAISQVLDLYTGSFSGGLVQNELTTGQNMSDVKASQPVTRTKQLGNHNGLPVEPLLVSRGGAKNLAIWMSKFQIGARPDTPLPLKTNLNEIWLPDTPEAADLKNSAGDYTPNTGQILEAPIGYGHLGPVNLNLAAGTNAVITGETTLSRANVIASYLAGMAIKNSPAVVNFLIFDTRKIPWTDLLTTSHCLGLETGRGEQTFSRLMHYLEAETANREDWFDAHGGVNLELARQQNLTAPAELIVVVASAEAFTASQLSDLIGRIHLYRNLGIHLILSVGDPQRIPPESLKYLPARVVLDLDEEGLTRICGSVDIDAQRVFTQPGRAVVISSGVGSEIQSFNALEPITVEDACPLKFIPLSGSGKLDTDLLKVRRGEHLGRAGEIPLSLLPGSFRKGKAWGKPWLGQLGSKYDLSKLGVNSDAQLTLGVQDDIGHQRILTFGFSPDTHGSLLVTGSCGCGKTTALRALAAASLNTSGIPVELYVMSGEPNWEVLDAWGNVGVVATAAEPEVIADTIDYLSGVVESRQQLQVGSASWQSRVIVLIDDLEMVLEALPAAAAGNLLQIVTGGRAVQVHLAVSAASLESVPNAWRSVFKQRVELHRRGRGVLEGDSRPVQVAVLGSEAEESAQLRVLKRLTVVSKRFRAHKIRRQAVPIYVSDLAAAPGGHIPLGLEVSTGKQFDIPTRGVCLLTGEPGVGLTTALRYLAGAVRRVSQDTGLVFLTLRDGSEESAWNLWDVAVSGETEISEYYHQLLSVASRQSPPDFPGLAIFVEDLPVFAQYHELSEAFVQLVESVRVNGHLLVATGNCEDWSSQSVLPAAVKSPARGLALGLSARQAQRIFGVKVSQDGGVFPPGRGYWIADGQAFKVQLPLEH